MLSKYQREVGTENPYFLVVVRLLLICYCLLFPCGIVSVTVLQENVPGTREPSLFFFYACATCQALPVDNQMKEVLLTPFLLLRSCGHR